MKKIKVFDVVELNNKDRATILNCDNNEYLAEIVGQDGIRKDVCIINENNIHKIIFSKKT